MNVTSSRTYRVAELATLTGVTVRTLHHYDAIGLLVPSGRSRAGYRLYSESDLFRLQQILIQRELGLPLEQIRRALDDVDFDVRQALLEQKQALSQRLTATRSLLSAVDAAPIRLNTTTARGGTMQDLFQGFNPEQYTEEAEQRWGDTAAYRESAWRTKRYNAADWARFRDEQTKVYERLADLMRANRAAGSPEVIALVEQHRLLIDRWFYPCDQAMHENLASLYEADERFAQSINSHADGLAAYLVTAIRAARA